MKPESLDFTGFFGFRISLPLHRSRGLGGYVVDYAVDVGYFVYYAVGYAAEYFIGDVRPVGCHEIDRGDSADGYKAFCRSEKSYRWKASLIIRAASVAGIFVFSIRR